jgi:outer membrane receptor protein involved in Fe transport
LVLTPLRAWAHNVPRYYVQNFGNPASHPDSNDYAVFAQDTARLTPHFSFSLGARYDLQTFATMGMVNNPLWAPAGKMPSRETNFAPRLGIGYAIGNDRPIMVRAGPGIFYTRIPQIYESAVMNGNGLRNTFLSLDNADYYQRQVFPSYPKAAINCPRGPTSCTLPDAWKQYATTEISAFLRTSRLRERSREA